MPLSNPLPSPCNGLCSFERRTGFCIGCARTRAEVVGWRIATEDVRDRIGAQLAGRRSRLGFVHRLPWSLEEVKTFVLATFAGAGTWVSGVNGAIGAFRRDANEDVVLDTAGYSLSARTGRAAISFKLSSRLRAYTVSLTPEDEPLERTPAAALSELVVIAVARRCGLDETEKGLTRLGIDPDALLGDGRTEHLYDFGLGDCAGSFGIRTADPTLAQSLDRYLGHEWPAFLQTLRDEIVGAAPTRVVRSPLGRVEVSTPLWSGVSAGGPYTQFLPARLALGTTAPAPGIMDSYLACAVYHPYAPRLPLA